MPLFSTYTTATKIYSSTVPANSFMNLLNTDFGKLEILGNNATALRVLMSQSNALPIWSTPTYPNAATVGNILKADGTNIVLSTTLPDGLTFGTLGADWSVGDGRAITLTSSAAGSTVAPILLTLADTNADIHSPKQLFKKLSASPADNDVLGGMIFVGYNDAAIPEETYYAQIDVRAIDVSDGTEDGEIRLNVAVAGTYKQVLTVREGGVSIGIATLAGCFQAHQTAYAASTAGMTYGELFATRPSLKLGTSILQDDYTGSRFLFAPRGDTFSVVSNDGTKYVFEAGLTGTQPYISVGKDATNPILQIGYDTGDQVKITGNIGFYNTTPVAKATALTTQLTTITHTAPGTPDYALQDLVQNTGFGFATKDEGNTLLSVVANLQTRLAELETRGKNYGLLT